MAASLPSQTSTVGKINKEERDESIEKVERSYQRYKEIISTLPKEKGWLAEDMCQYQGFWYQPMHGLEGVMFAQEHFQARPDDVFLISVPKSGSTWLKAIIFAIMKRTCYPNSTHDHPLLITNPHDCVPSLEFVLFKKPPVADVENFSSPRLFATHIPYPSLPESVLSSGCNIVYVCRDPKDVLISIWYFLAKVRSKELPPLSLEEAVELFSEGFFGFGPFWDHVQGYLKASQDSPDRFFFVTYEEMKRDTSAKVKKMAEFLGQPFSIEEEREGVVEEIVELCRFNKLRNLDVNKNGSRNPDFKNEVFFRKGHVGDWSNHLTTQMAERIDQITNEKLPESYNKRESVVLAVAVSIIFSIVIILMNVIG